MTTFASVAADKTPTGSTVRLRERPYAHPALAEAEARLRAGRAFVMEEVAAVWSATCAGRCVSRQERALLRLACASCCRESVAAVDGVAAEAGMTASVGSRAFARAIRDVRVVPQHTWVAPPAITDAGRVLLGLDPLSRAL